jgi:BT1 family protein
VFRFSYLPPLMVYLAAGVSGLTGIVGTFFVKEHLGISAEFLAALGFWAGIPWALKMPVGHFVDLIWRWKAALVYLGAALIAASLVIMVGLLEHRNAMSAFMSAEHWYVLSALLAPVGFMVQDAVADAMTVEAVPRVDDQGRAYDPPTQKAMHTTMQTLGRVAIIGGTVFVALLNVWFFRDAENLSGPAKAVLYADVYKYALAIPIVSIAGVVLHSLLKRRHPERLFAQDAKTEPNWWVLGGSLVFVAVTLAVGLSSVPRAEEIIFAGSCAVILFLLWRLVRELEPRARETLVATALVIFVFRAMPGPGAGATWWMIDVLNFDQSFLARLSLISSALTLAGMFIFRRYMAEKSIAQVIVMLTLVGTVLALPIIGMYHGLHEWTARHTGGVVDARFIMLVDTAVESPLGQIAMIPMLAWIANSAPGHLKATYFAVMASFSNVALSASQLGTKYLNEILIVTREVRDQASGAVKIPADYTELGALLVASTVIGFVLPLAAVAVVRAFKLRTA